MMGFDDVRRHLALAVLLCGQSSVTCSEDPSRLTGEPHHPRGSRVTIEMTPPIVWYGEPYTVTVRYENTGDGEREIFLPRETVRRPYKLLVFDASKRYVGELLRKARPGIDFSGAIFPTTCDDWIQVPAGGVLEDDLRFPGRYEMPARGEYFLQLSISERFFTQCPFRDVQCRWVKGSDAQRDGASANRATRDIIETRMRKLWENANPRKEAARSDALAVTFNDRRKTPDVPGDRADKASGNPQTEKRSGLHEMGALARLSAAGKLSVDSPADVLVLLEPGSSEDAIYNPFFDRASELPGTLQLLDEQGKIVVGDLLNRASTLTKVPDADLCLSMFRRRAGARFHLSVDRAGGLSVRSNDSEQQIDAQVAPGRYQLVFIFYKRAFQISRSNRCGFKEWEYDAWRSTNPGAVAFRSNIVELQVVDTTD